MRKVASDSREVSHSTYVRGWKSLPHYMVRELLSNANPLHLKERQTLFRCGDSSDGCFWLDSGFVKASVPTPYGHEALIRVLGPGSAIGDLALIAGPPRSESVTALTDCKLQSISQANFHICALRHPDIYRHLILVFADRVREMETNIAALASLNAKARVARALLLIAEMMGQKIPPNSILITKLIPQRDLAALAVVARENTNRILKDWERRKLLTISAHTFRINDAARLAQELERSD